MIMTDSWGLQQWLTDQPDISAKDWKYKPGIKRTVIRTHRIHTSSFCSKIGNMFRGHVSTFLLSSMSSDENR